MNLTFWMWASLLMALVIVLLAWPLVKRRGTTQVASRKAINVAIYKDQLAELGRDRDNGILATADYQRAREELERRALEDTVDEPAAADAPVAARVSRTALALVLAVPLLAVPLYMWLGNPAGLDPQAAVAAKADHGEEMTAERLEKLAAGLAAKLEKNPDNPQGWAMLGRSYKALDRLDEAEKAFAKAGSIMDSVPALMLEQVDLDAYKNNGRLSAKAQELLKKLLQKEPENGMALVHAGADAYYRQDYAKAISYWEHLLKMVEPGSDDARNLQTGVDKARELMGKHGPAPLSLPWSGNASNAAPEAAPTAAASSPAAEGASISGRVDMDAALKAKASPGDTVFIFARAVQGPRIPLAVLRVKVSDLPMDFKLDDSMAMRPDLRLSLADTVQVEARVSKSGDAVSKSGDLLGSIGPLKPGARDVKVHIDHVLP